MVHYSMMCYATAVAHPNIAFIKYWGNRDDALRLPAGGSISMNLAGIETRTSVAFDPLIAEDEFILDRKPQSGIALDRVSDHLALLRARAGMTWKARVSSANNFPLGAGIASSASGFAALTAAAAAALGLRLSERELTVLARRGSGSASRSIPGGFVEWRAADADEESYAESIAPPEHWALVDLIAVLDPAPKKVGSAEGNRLARTSPLQAERVADSPRRLEICRRAIRMRDFPALAEISEEDTGRMIEVMRTSVPALDYQTPATADLMQSVRRWRAEGLPAAYSVDAGPNVHCLCPEESSAEVECRLREHPAVRQILRARPGRGARVISS
ncbi:MAG: diphosphomevalonate decarboxylase [Anaerolineales bacterium]|nr:diphosphomevalonate decarboxylase [Anaerolineales bacterium]